MKSTLFSYCIPIDDGAAPNPFWGFCTLVICKPQIRRVALPGDWIVGTGSKNSPIGDASGCVVYAMRVTRVLTMLAYERFVQEQCPEKVPDWTTDDARHRVGDAIFDFRESPPRMRASVHSENVEEHRARDLGGKNALVSDHFFYFGDCPPPLPPHLRRIVKQGQGFKSRANDGMLDPFLKWLYGLGLAPNVLHGEPQFRMFLDADEENVAAILEEGSCSSQTCSSQLSSEIRSRRKGC